MKYLVLAAALLTAGESQAADAPKSGVPPGKFVSGFESVKCAGAKADGVKIGAQLCYVCKYEERPVVLIFARKTSANLGRLVAELDKAVVKHADKRLGAIVALIGAKRESLHARAKRLGTKHKIQKIPIIVPVKEIENGPADFKLNPKAELTVMIYVEGKVKVNRAFAAGGLGKKEIQSVLRDLAKILK